MYLFYFYKKTVRVGNIGIFVSVIYRVPCEYWTFIIIDILFQLAVKHEPNDWGKSEERRLLYQLLLI